MHCTCWTSCTWNRTGLLRTLFMKKPSSVSLGSLSCKSRHLFSNVLDIIFLLLSSLIKKNTNLKSYHIVVPNLVNQMHMAFLYDSILQRDIMLRSSTNACIHYKDDTYGLKLLNLYYFGDISMKILSPSSSHYTIG